MRALPTRGEVVRIRDERWTVAESAAHPTVTLLTVVGCDRLNRGVRARFLLPFEPLERIPAVATTRMVSMRQWRRRVRAVMAQTTPSVASLRAASNADISILPYQLEPALAVARGLAARILIADDVGLGKTIQAGLIVAEVLARNEGARALVVCPASLRDQWRTELADRFHLVPAVLDSMSLQYAAPDGANPWAVCPLVLTSMDFIKRPEVIRALEPLVWDLLVIDEAHGTAGQSDRHAATALLSQRARTVVMLTATPHSGSDASFERLTGTGDIDASFPLLIFRRTRQMVSSSTVRRTRWLPVHPTAAELEMHTALMAYVRRVWRRPASPAAPLAMIVLTRRACSSASSLARTVERRLTLLSHHVSDDTQLQLPLYPGVDDEEPGVEIGAPGLTDSRDERQALEGILALARTAAGSECKLRALTRLLRRSNEPAIIFTEYRDTLAVLDRTLSCFGTCQLHGGLAAAERAAALKRFARGDSRILLATDAASEGLNLHHRCRQVVHLEVPWTPTRIEQRVGRVDRIGQTRTVHQLLLVTAGTVEESRVREVALRTQRAAAALDRVSPGSTDDRRTASYVIGDGPLPQPPHTQADAVSPAGLITADLRHQAAAEAARLGVARELARTAAPAPEYARPFAARCRRRPPPPALWAVWCEYADSHGYRIWETLAGIEGRPRTSAHSTSHARELLDSWWTRVCAIAENQRAGDSDPSLDVIRTFTALALTRENAIARGIERRRARMAAELVQKALFDRRAERDAAAQRELILQALDRCHARTKTLERLNSMTVAVRPAFALLSW